MTEALRLRRYDSAGLLIEEHVADDEDRFDPPVDTVRGDWLLAYVPVPPLTDVPGVLHPVRESLPVRSRADLNRRRFFGAWPATVPADGGKTLPAPSADLPD